MRSTDGLSDEHKAIGIVLNAFERCADTLDRGDHVDPSLVADCLDFASGFADKCHHAKEEHVLFPALQERGILREGGPIGVMLHEHDQGRAFLKAVRIHLDAWTRGDEAATDGLTQAIHNYVNLLRRHIAKEDQVLFVAASGVLSEEEDQRILDGFEKIEEETIGPGVHERYHRMIDDIKERTDRL